MQKTFPATLDQLYTILAFIRSCCQKHFAPEQLSKIELACEEALVNIIHYGYPKEKGLIEVHCSDLPQQGIKIVLKDKGIPFNPLDKGKEMPVNPSIGGYGIFLIHQIMDQVEYQRDGDFNVLTMIKNAEGSNSI